MSVRQTIRRATPEPPDDLWPRLRARLDDDDVVRLRAPALGWREALAAGIAIGTLAAVPDPVRLLVVSGLF